MPRLDLFVFCQFGREAFDPPIDVGASREVVRSAEHCARRDFDFPLGRPVANASLVGIDEYCVFHFHFGFGFG
jgi:hypothetical protein